MTQRKRVLRALQRAGATGLTQADWLRQPTPDGGPPITRLAARVEELRDEYEIASNGRRDSCVVYVLQPNRDPARCPMLLCDAICTARTCTCRPCACPRCLERALAAAKKRLRGDVERDQAEEPLQLTLEDVA